MPLRSSWPALGLPGHPVFKVGSLCPGYNQPAILSQKVDLPYRWMDGMVKIAASLSTQGIYTQVVLL